MLAVAIEHLEHAHVGVVDGYVVAFLEGDPVQLVRSIEDPLLQHRVQLEIRLGGVTVEIEPGLLHPIGIAVPIPWLDGEALAASLDRRVQLVGLAFLLGGGGGDQPGHERLGIVRRLRHLIGEHIIGPGRETQQGRLPGAQLGDLGDRGARVVGVALHRTGPTRLEQLLAHGAIVE